MLSTLRTAFRRFSIQEASLYDERLFVTAIFRGLPAQIAEQNEHTRHNEPDQARYCRSPGVLILREDGP